MVSVVAVVVVVVCLATTASPLVAVVSVTVTDVVWIRSFVDMSAAVQGLEWHVMAPEMID
jgi:hypothetical protein